jgi:hypothetical protein
MRVRAVGVIQVLTYFQEAGVSGSTVHVVLRGRRPL